MCVGCAFCVLVSVVCARGVSLCVVLVLVLVRNVWCVLSVTPRVLVKNVSVCTFRTHPCVPAKRAHVFNMRAFCRYTRKRFERTHGDVFNLHNQHTERREG